MRPTTSALKGVLLRSFGMCFPGALAAGGFGRKDFPQSIGQSPDCAAGDSCGARRRPPLDYISSVGLGSAWPADAVAFRFAFASLWAHQDDVSDRLLWTIFGN